MIKHYDIETPISTSVRGTLYLDRAFNTGPLRVMPQLSWVEDGCQRGHGNSLLMTS